MSYKSSLALATAGFLLGAATSLAQPAYPPPPGGWTYMYQGDQAIAGPPNACGSGVNTPPTCPEGWNSLDGTWTHDNNSDTWDGSIIGGTLNTNEVYGTANTPGGVMVITNASTTFARMQDCGDPRDYGFPESAGANIFSNRKIYFGHNIGSDLDPVKAQTIMRSGVTLTFRARIPTLAKAGPPLDPLMRDGQQAGGQLPYPASGDGYVTSDGGKGNFVIREAGNGADVPAAAIAFSLTQTNDTTGGGLTPVAGFAGLTFNEFSGNIPSANVNFGQGSKTNVVAFDPTEWHEIYIVLRDDPADIGTHEAFIFVDGNLIPTVFKITGGTGSDMNDSFLAVGGSATGQNWALDVDWFGYKDEAVFPPGALLPPSIFGFAPADRTLFHASTNGLRFQTSALMPTNRLPASGISVILNGQNVTSQLTLTGTDVSQSRTVTYNGLQPNLVYAATYIVIDSGGLGTTNDISFDTFVEGQVKLLEADEYNHSGGQFTDNPPPGSYASAAGLAGVDFLDTTPNDVSPYRGDAVDAAISTDLARNKYTSVGQTDYMLQNIIDGEWWNYTGGFGAPPYNVWLRYSSTANRQLRLDRVTGNPTQPNQTVQFVGVFNAPSSGSLNRFIYAQLLDVQGNPVVLTTSGNTTYRLTALGGNNDLNLNYVFFVPGATALTSPQATVTPLPNAVGVRGDAVVEATINDGSNPVTLGSVKLLVNGAEMTVTKAKSGSVTTVKYPPSPLWAPNTTYTLSLIYNDGTDRTNTWSFTTANYAVLTAAMKAGNATVPGFVWRMHQNEANQETSVQKALNALSGALGLPNLADPNAVGPASGPGTPANPGNGTMTFNIPTVINVSEVGGDNRGSFTPDDQMPGIPGTTASDEGIAVEINAFIQLASGFHSMAINCDDGFRTTAGYVNDANALTVGIREPGGGAADTVFNFAVQESGVYAFRTIFFEGGGDSSIEWFTLKPDGTRALINDAASGGVTSFQQGTIPSPPANVMISARLNASGQVVLDWSSGTLLSADTVHGIYAPVTGATSPHTVNPTNAPAKFYRVQVSP